MEIIETNIKDLYIIKPTVHGDYRGWFTESFRDDKLKEKGINVVFVQDNHSFSKEAGTLRGLHFQLEPYAQSKLVRCTKGKILDVAVDLRKNSATYLKWFSIELSDENYLQLFVPKGFGHGFVTLDENVEVQYKVDNYYHKASDRSIRFDDSVLNIDWNIENPILSEKDLKAPLLKDSDVNF